MQPLQLHPFSNPSLPPIPARLLKSIQARLYIVLSSCCQRLWQMPLIAPPPPLKRGRRTREGGPGKQGKQFFISNPLDWGLAFATFAAACSHYHPEMAPKLLVYCGIIFRGRRQPLYCFHFNFQYITLVR